jgi:hypothetical protein
VKRTPLLAVVAVALVVSATHTWAQGRQGGAGRGGAAGAAPAAPATPRTQAPIDITGNWVAIISEDWRWRMVTPAKGDFPSIPMTPEAERVAEAWNPAKDEAAGEACRAYGAPGLMRGPVRLRISWADDKTLKMESDYGVQTRLFTFGAAPANPGPRSWQGTSIAQWVINGGGRGRGAQRSGSLKAVTTNLRPGYLRKNGVPYSENAVFTEYFDLMKEDNGDQYLVDTNVVNDPKYLQAPFMTAIHFKKEPDGSKYDPTPCDARF